MVTATAAAAAATVATAGLFIFPLLMGIFDPGAATVLAMVLLTINDAETFVKITHEAINKS